MPVYRLILLHNSTNLSLEAVVHTFKLTPFCMCTKRHCFVLHSKIYSHCLGALEFSKSQSSSYAKFAGRAALGIRNPSMLPYKDNFVHNYV